MTAFLQQLQRGTNLTETENGAVTNQSSLDPVVDFFSLAGAMRSNPADAVILFGKAFNVDPQTALRTLFYLRDVRGGQGERDVFRACFRWLGDHDPAAAEANFDLIPEYGRWDDIFHVGSFGDAIDLVKSQLDQDLDAYRAGQAVSLLAKWLPSENASSAATKALAKRVRLALDGTPAQYRRTLSGLRARIRLLEQDMSRSNWDGIDYGKLPGQAHRRHVKAFKRHTPDRYQSYLDSVTKGEAKINVSNVYPYEIYNMVQQGQEGYANVAWDNLPDYTDGKNALVLADVSGSMYGQPMAVSVSLALYFAERNTGPFKDFFMTFESEPHLLKATGNTVAQRMRSIESAPWGGSTNLSAAFRSILHAAINAGGEAPSVLYIISDMEFDSATGAAGSYDLMPVRELVQTPWGPQYRQGFKRVHTARQPQDTVFATAEREFAEVGLTLPHVVFWNVNARQAQAPATILDGRVSLVSGLSPVVFAMAVEGKSPRELVDSVVNAERYQRVVA